MKIKEKGNLQSRNLKTNTIKKKLTNTYKTAFYKKKLICFRYFANIRQITYVTLTKQK